MDQSPNGRGQRLLRKLRNAVSWTPPTSTEVGVVLKSGLAAGLAWWIARTVSGVSNPVLASLTSIVVIQVSVRTSIVSAIQRSLAVVLGVLLALAIGDALSLNPFTVALIVILTLGVAELLLRLPSAAARQVPISGLVVIGAVSANPASQGWDRAVDTLIGAVVGVVVSFVLPASRLVDARQTLDRLGGSMSGVLTEMGKGLQETWSVEQTEGWRRTARTTRERLVGQAAEAVGNGRDAARWNVRDRRHLAELSHYERVLPRLERTAIGVSVISRGLDDHARITGTSHRAMPSMGQLLVALADAVSTYVQDMVHGSADPDLDSAIEELRARRQRCMEAASRRALLAIDSAEAADHDEIEGEWLSYVALLVQVDRIVADLNAPLPA